LAVLGDSTTQFVCVFDPNGCPSGTAFRAVAGAGSFCGARSVLVYDPQTETVVAAMVNRDETPGLEEFVRNVLDAVGSRENGGASTSSS
jgi:hypothetical protein